MTTTPLSLAKTREDDSGPMFQKMPTTLPFANGGKRASAEREEIIGAMNKKCDDNP